MRFQKNDVGKELTYKHHRVTDSRTKPMVFANYYISRQQLCCIRRKPPQKKRKLIVLWLISFPEERNGARILSVATIINHVYFLKDTFFLKDLPQSDLVPYNRDSKESQQQQQAAAAAAAQSSTGAAGQSTTTSSHDYWTHHRTPKEKSRNSWKSGFPIF